ncbi:MAG TPA: ABC transporter substrate-binding protein [Dermatophilaceae bacterium]|nr:ABC transporter substrate-binding protein [Dermatophilaceae bacterium]
MRRRMLMAAATGAALTLALAACSGSGIKNGSGSGGTSSSSGSSSFNAANGKVLRESSTKGGTLRFANAGDWDSLDPGDTYYGYSWNFLRNYARTLLVFKAAPGEGGNELVPDLATSLGKPSDDAKTWTYTLRDGLKFEDGSPITSKDVAYGVARSLDKETLPNGYTYFNDFLADIPDGFSVFKGGKVADLKAIETPDDKTIVFHLNKPFSGFDYFAQLPATAPVPQAKDTGAKYKEKIVSSGPYKFATNEIGKKFTLVRNENYDPATDPDSGRKPLADTLEVTLNVNAEDIDKRLMAGDLDVDIAGTGVQPATQGLVQTEPNKSKTDLAEVARLWFTVINSDVAPFDKLDCRKAVLYAADKTGYQRAYGGNVGGDIATSLMPKVIPGAIDIDLYEAKTKPQGDVDKAKAALSACGQPNGFETNVSYRTERPKEKAVAEALQQSLSKVGIKLTLKPYATADYTKLYAGKPDYAKANKLGLIIYGWGADWNDGFGFLQQIIDSRVIRAAGGNTNLGIRLPAVDKLIDQALATTDKAAREKLWGDADRTVMENAAVLPGVWAKGLLYRPDNLTNVFVNQAYGMYDYAAIGTSRK